MMTFDKCKTFDAQGIETGRAIKVTFDGDTVQVGHTTHRRDELIVDWTKGEIESIHGWSAEFETSMHAEFCKQQENESIYDVVKNNENGSSDLISEGLAKVEAIAKATELAETTKGITVEFIRKSDGQHGFLNQDGNHDVTGKHWS